ncbi:MAG: hypothetical protein H7Y19_12960 [Luteimonas sp.]|nr:hypothetical protein [Luteimonas sp.]
MNMRKVLVFSTLAALSGLVFAGGDKSAADKIKALDTDADGQVSATEFTAAGKTQADFTSIDANKDGFATAAELDAHMAMNKDDTHQMDKPVKTDADASTSTTPPNDG